MNKFKSISPSKAIELSYDDGRIPVYITTTISKKRPLLEIYCEVELEEHISKFPFSNTPSSTEPVAKFFTDIAEFSLLKRTYFLPQLRKDVEKVLDIEYKDFKDYKIFFDLDLSIGNVHRYNELPGQPPTNGEQQELLLVEKFQGEYVLFTKKFVLQIGIRYFSKTSVQRVRNFFHKLGNQLRHRR